MWVYEKALQFNVDIKNKDARMAKHIIAQYGGPFCKNILKKGRNS